MASLYLRNIKKEHHWIFPRKECSELVILKWKILWVNGISKAICSLQGIFSWKDYNREKYV